MFEAKPSRTIRLVGEIQMFSSPDQAMAIASMLF